MPCFVLGLLKTFQSEKDAQLPNILNPNYKLQSHGVHTFEHLRPLIVATYAKNNPEMEQALVTFIQRIREVSTTTGGPIGDEWIAERKANATHTGYEYCSIHELLDSYSVLLQKVEKQNSEMTSKLYFIMLLKGAEILIIRA